MDTQPPLAQLLVGTGHIYLLRQQHREVYKVVGSPQRLAGRNLEMALEGVDRAQSLVLVFHEYRAHSAHLTVFRKDDAQFLAPGHVTRATRWVVGAGRDALLAQATRDAAAVVVPMVTLHPIDPVALEALKALDLAIQEEQRQRRELQNAEANRKRREEYALEQEAEARRIQGMREAILQQALDAGDIISAATAPDEWAARVTKRLGFLARVTNGHCELRAVPGSGYELVFYIFPAHMAKLRTALLALMQTRVLRGNLSIKDATAQTESDALFGPVSWGHQTRWGTSRRCTLEIACNTPALLPELLALTPGVRGWDLPRDAATHGFDPSRRRGHTRGLQAPDEDAVAE